MTAAPAVAADAITRTPRQALRRGRFWIGVAVAAVLLALLGLVLHGGAGSTGAFAPDNAAPAGGRALAQVLGQQGVSVQSTVVVDDALADASGATLLVDDSDDLLSAAQWRRLTAAAARLVVVSPGATALQVLAPDVRPGGVPNASHASAACSVPLAVRAGAMSLAGAERSLVADGACFADTRGAGQLVARTSGSTPVLLLADPVPFENSRITSAGNAAVALAALGARPDLVWLQPDPLTGGPGTPATLQSLTPPWVTPLILLVIAAAIAAAIWRGRRFGPLVVERLPVVVRSRETVEGRARLYQAAGARMRAADALRIGTVSRLAPALGLGRLASVADVTAAAATRTGRPTPEIEALLVGASPRTDAELVAVSDGLIRLESAVSAAAAAGLPAPRATTTPSEAPIAAPDERNRP